MSHGINIAFFNLLIVSPLAYFKINGMAQLSTFLSMLDCYLHSISPDASRVPLFKEKRARERVTLYVQFLYNQTIQTQTFRI